MTPRYPIGVIVHADFAIPDIVQNLLRLGSFLTQHNVPTVFLVECPTFAAASAVTSAFATLAPSSCVKISIVQPLNLFASFNAAKGYVSGLAQHLAVVSFAKNKSPALSAAPDALVIDPTTILDNTYTITLLHIAAIIKKYNHQTLCVGYFMKEKRQTSLIQNGMLPFMPPLDEDPYSVFFVPLHAPIEGKQEKREGVRNYVSIVDVYLHKPTDFLSTCSYSSTRIPSYLACVSNNLDTLQNAIVVDPLENLESILDRVKMAQALEEACTAARKLALPVRSPAWHPIEELNIGALRAARTQSHVSLPCVVKPRVACGVSEAHQMAFILHPSALAPSPLSNDQSTLNDASLIDVPLPAVFQEYIDHGGICYKCYVAGDSVFTAQKKSTPDLAGLKEYLTGTLSPISSPGHSRHASIASVASSIGEMLHLNGGGGAREKRVDDEVPACIEFHSLESLPTSLPWLVDTSAKAETPTLSAAPPMLLRPEFFEQIASVLQQYFKLTLFGFDVVFDYAAGEAVIVDVNFFPSFQGIQEAPRAVRKAIHEAFDRRHKEGQTP